METKSPLPFTRLIALLISFLPLATFGEGDKVSDRHVVVLVWDGMRPDFITERSTPTLWKLAREGVTFRHHHSVYPTATNVNGAAIATGAYPNHNGLLANHEYRPRIDPQRSFENGQPDIIKKGDETSDGKYLTLPTIAEIVRAAGRRTAIAGTKSVAFLFDRHAEWTSAATKDSITRFAAAPVPSGAREQLLHLLGPFLVEPGNSSDQRNAYATRALTEILWRDGVPDFSLLWLSDPDLAQHAHSPGAEPSMAAIRGSDRNLAVVLDALSSQHARDKTDVLVVSDHGFSTVERGINFPETLRAAGFDAVATFEQPPKPGQIMVAENGGSILFYIIGHDRAIAGRLIEWLQHSEFAGVIFAREAFEGTFLSESVSANIPEGPDVMVALRWKAKPNRFGIPGQIFGDETRGAGQGNHASLSQYDVHNTLVAAGPDFRRGLMSDTPSGNIDLAPTILRILGLDAPHKFDGRILSEAMKSGSTPPFPVTKTLNVARKFDSGVWRQHLRISRVGETTYFDEGNGAFDTPTRSGALKSPKP